MEEVAPEGAEQAVDDQHRNHDSNVQPYILIFKLKSLEHYFAVEVPRRRRYGIKVSACVREKFRDQRGEDHGV